MEAPAIPDQRVRWPSFERAGWEVVIRREDLIHPLISGNKFRKLKYNIREALDQSRSSLITLGGAYSNHILAVAAIGRENRLETFGLIRGDELSPDANPTLREAKALGMKFHFLSRPLYKWLTRSEDLLHSWKEPAPPMLSAEFESLLAVLNPFNGNHYLIPEGGTNALAVRGCMEILGQEDREFDYVCCPVGTGGTLAGISSAAMPGQRVIGFSALIGGVGLNRVISKFTPRSNWEITDAFALGGYGKVSDALVEFMNRFRELGNCRLDPIYTAKMLWGLDTWADSGKWPAGTRVLLIHTGGLQGVRGINEQRKMQNRPLICEE